MRARQPLAREPRRRAGVDEIVHDQHAASAVGEKFGADILEDAQLAPRGVIDAYTESDVADDYRKRLRIKTPSVDVGVAKLSGGNQQKVVLGKALMTGPKIILLDEPTRGIDVGAKLEIYEIINRLTAEGKAVLLVSSELPELIGMSDRILMLHEGRIGGEFTRAEATQERLMAAAMGQ